MAHTGFYKAGGLAAAAQLDHHTASACVSDDSLAAQGLQDHRTAAGHQVPPLCILLQRHMQHRGSAAAGSQAKLRRRQRRMLHTGLRDGSWLGGCGGKLSCCWRCAHGLQRPGRPAKQGLGAPVQGRADGST